MMWQSGLPLVVTAEAMALFAHAQKSLRLQRRFDGVERRRDVAIGAVFEAQRHGQTRRHLAMNLRFGRARADRRPTDQIGDILRRNRI